MEKVEFRPEDLKEFLSEFPQIVKEYDTVTHTSTETLVTDLGIGEIFKENAIKIKLLYFFRGVVFARVYPEEVVIKEDGVKLAEPLTVTDVFDYWFSHGGDKQGHETLLKTLSAISPTGGVDWIRRYVWMGLWYGKKYPEKLRLKEAVEQKGFFGKIKEKYEAHQEAVEQKREEELEKELKKEIERLNTAMNKSLKDITSAPVEYKPLTIGTTFGVTGGFTTNDNVPIVSYITIESCRTEGIGRKLLVYPINFIFGSFADRPIPLSLITKIISTGFMRSERVFIPFQMQPNLQFDVKTIWKNKMNWNPLVETMNEDKQLISALSSLPNETAVQLSSKRWLTYKIEDKNERNVECVCQIVPYENLTFIGIRVLGANDKVIKNVINALRMIRGHILSYGHGTPVTGQLAQDWIKIPIALFQSAAKT